MTFEVVRHQLPLFEEDGRARSTSRLRDKRRARRGEEKRRRSQSRHESARFLTFGRKPVSSPINGRNEHSL